MMLCWGDAAKRLWLPHAFIFLPGAGHSYLVLLLIGLLDEGARDLVELTERRYHPDGLSAALLGGLW